MNSRLFKAATIALTVLLFFPGRNASGADMPNIIIITLSGVRNSETIDDPAHQYIPHIFGDLFKEGVLYTQLIDANCEFHMPAVDSINTGKDYQGFWGRIKSPSLFQYIRKKYSLPATKLWSIGHWIYNGCAYATGDFPQTTYPCQIATFNAPTRPVLIKSSPELESIFTEQENSFVRSFNQQIGINRHVQYWDSLGEIMYGIFKKVVAEFKPNFIHYVMGEPESGHYGSYSRYVLAVKQCDERIFEIWQMIQADPFYKGRTFLIVTPDHYRDAYYMQHGENPHDNPSKVWMYIYGPGIKKGISIARPVSHKDIFATVAYLMRLEEARPWGGELLEDCFVNLKK